MFLDNDQLVHLQAMANAQAHFVVQQQSTTGQTDSHAEDQDQQQGSYLLIELKIAYRLSSIVE